MVKHYLTEFCQVTVAVGQTIMDFPEPSEHLEAS